MRERCGRQLLVAMIEATSGKKFEEKVVEEYRELSELAKLFYAVICLASFMETWLTKAEILGASPTAGNEEINAYQSLMNVHLVNSDEQGRVRCRHAVIAECICEYLREEGALATVVGGITFSLAQRVLPTMSMRTRIRSLLARLLNHDWMMRNMSIRAARIIYGELEDQLSWDFHFWLQRGSVEVEDGSDFTAAENYLSSARSIDAENHKVRTEWAYLHMKRAARAENPEGQLEAVEEAFADLEEVIADNGRNDRYPYHVLGSQALAYVNRAGSLPLEQRAVLLARARALVDEGRNNHPRAAELETLYRDLTQGYLNLAV
jgi:hypothetical protein